MHIEIKNHYTGAVIFGGEYESLRSAVFAAIKSRADLSWANLSWADLSWANLSWANLSGVILTAAKGAELVISRTRILPEGSIIGWKKCRNDVLVKLLIPAGVKRSHAFGRKCRAASAKVLEVIGADVAESQYDGMKYVPGETVRPSAKFDEDWTSECASGIHFYITREEAEAH